jgi:hypothetical protein
MYIGNDLQIAHPSYKIIDDISSSFNGSTTSFALNVNGATPVPFPISTQQVMISVNGVVQEPDPNGNAGFKLLGSNIVFSSAPANGHAFFGVINAGADYVTAGSEFPDGSATAPSFTFQDDQDTGWFRSGSGAVGFSSNGVNTIGFDGNGLTVTGDATFTGDSSKNLFWDKSDGQLEFADNAKAIFGTGSDLSVFHDGSHSYLSNTTGNLYITEDGYIELSSANGGEKYATFNKDGAVELYYNNVKVFNTDGAGIMVKGPEGGSANIYLYADEGDDNNDKFQLTVNDGGPFHIQNRASGSVENNIKCYGGGAVELYYDNVKQVRTSSTGIFLEDSKRVDLGTGADLRLVHDGSHGYVQNNTGNLRIDGDLIQLRKGDGTENYLIGNADGDVELYHNGVKKLETTSSGTKVTGMLHFDAAVSPNISVPDNGKIAVGTGDDLQIFHDGTQNLIEGTAPLYIKGSNVVIYKGGTTEKMLQCNGDGEASLWYDNVKRVATTSTGINVTGAINVNGAALSTAPQITANADGSISVGDAVLIQANGTVKKIETTTTSANLTYRNVATLNSETSQYLQIAADPRTANRWAITYNDDVGTKYTQLKVITRSGTTITESSWHRVSNSTNVMYSAPCWDPAADNRIIVFDQRGSNNTAQLVSFTGSAGSESFTNHTAFQMFSSYWTEPWENARTLPLPLGNTGYFLFNYWDNNQIRTKLILLSGNTISSGSSGVQILITGSTAMGGFAINPEDPTKGFVTYKNSSNKWCVRPITFGGSGSSRTTTLGSEEQLSTTTVGGNAPFLRLVYVDGDHFVANCKMNDGVSNWGAHTILVKYVGTTYTKSPIVLPPTNLTGTLAGNNQPDFGSLSNNLTTDPKTLVMCNTYSGGGVTTAYRGQAMSNIGTVNTDNMTISWSNQVQIDTSNTNDLYYVNIAQSSGAEQPTVLIYTKDGTPYVHAQLYLSGSTSSNLSDRFIGFSSAGYTNGQAATINVIGATTTKSSLTPASDYYVTKTGALATTADNPSVKAGVAVSSTKLLIKGH